MIATVSGRFPLENKIVGTTKKISGFRGRHQSKRKLNRDTQRWDKNLPMNAPPFFHSSVYSDPSKSSSPLLHKASFSYPDSLTTSLPHSVYLAIIHGRFCLPNSTPGFETAGPMSHILCFPENKT